MSDLEKLWDDLPAGRPPVDAILREGRRASATRRRRVVTRPLITAGVVTGLAAAFVAGTTVGPLDGGSGSSSDTAAGGAMDTAPSLAAFQADLKPAASCDALLSVYQNRALGMVTAYGWTNPIRYPLAYADLAVNGIGAAKTALQTSRGATSDTGTNIQEAGVDEPDTVKTNGSLLVRVRDDELEVYDVSGSTAVKDATLMLTDVDDPELLLSGTTVVVIGADSTSPTDDAGERTGSRVETVSLTDPANPTVTDDVAYDSTVLSARQHGTTIRLVLSSGLPELDFVQPVAKRTQKEALAQNRQVVKDSTITDWLPTYDTGDGTAPLLDCRNVAVPPAKLGLDTVSVVGFDASAPTTLSAIGLAGATTIAYESADDLYLAGSPSPSWTGGCALRCSMPWMPSGSTTYLFDFALDGVNATHVASGEVAGTIADRWSVDSVDGVLRVAVEPSSRTGNFNSIVTFERRGTDLVEDGRVDHIGQGEELKAVRWFDDMTILVTYHQIDPLFVVDLTDDAHPRLVGSLKVPGYSDYLHPLGPARILAVGRGRDENGHWGAQLGLFGVVHLPRVRAINTWHYGRGTTAVASSDPRAFTWLPDRRTALLVVRHGRQGFLSVQQLHDDVLHETQIPVGYGADIKGVRTMELPDQRVVLVTADGVRFLTDDEVGPLRTVEG